MKNKTYKNAILINLKNFKNTDLDKIEITPSLRDRAETDNASKRVLSLTTFQKIFKHQEQPYYLIANRFCFFRLKIEKRDIPSSTVNEELEIKVAKITERNGEKPKPKEIKEIKEDIIKSMLPNAFIKSSYIDFCIDKEKEILIANVSSINKIEDVISKIREYTDVNYDLNEEKDLSLMMTNWLKTNDIPECFELEDFVSLEDLGTGGVSEHKKDLIENVQEEINSSLEQNKIVKSISLNWHKRLKFTLTDQFVIKSIKPTDVFMEYIEEEVGGSVDEISYFESSMFNFISDVIEVFEDIQKAE